jgi:hypothetical protein
MLGVLGGDVTRRQSLNMLVSTSEPLVLHSLWGRLILPNSSQAGV